MIYFKRTGKQRPNSEGNSGTKTKSGNREHKKTFLFILGEQGNKPIYFRGIREQVPNLGRPAPGEGGACWSVVY